jgi:hypothetical protein
LISPVRASALLRGDGEPDHGRRHHGTLWCSLPVRIMRRADPGSRHARTRAAHTDGDHSGQTNHRGRWRRVAGVVARNG